MTTLAEIEATGRSGLVISYSADQKHGEQLGYKWLTGTGMPSVSLIGAMIRAQGMLLAGEFLPTIEEQMFVLVFDQQEGFVYWFNDGVPPDPVVGMLELIKGMVVAAKVAEQRGPAARVPGPGRVNRPHGLFGPDGQPWRGM